MSSKQKQVEDEQIFKIGTEVEVTTDEQGFKNSWYKCKIIPPPKPNKSPSSKNYRKRKKNFHFVEYELIVEEDDISKPLIEYIDASFIRPLPPRPTTTCDQNKNMFEKFDIVEASHREGWWIGVILDVRNNGLKYLVGFDSPYEELEFSRDDLRVHLSWLGGDKWAPPTKKSPVRSPEDGSETVVAFLLESISPAKRLKQATSIDAKRGQSSGLRNTVQALAAQPPLLESCRLSSSEGNTNRALKLSDRHSNCSMALNPNIVSHTLQGNNKQNDGKSSKTKKRAGPAKSAVQRLLNSLQIGEECGESGTMHDSVIEPSPTSDHAGEEHGESGVVHDSTIEPSSTTDSAGQSQSLPFTKTSEMWKVIESMEVFEKFPQKPHFLPLNEHEENAREMLAICMMSKFAYEVERITARSNDAQSIKTIHASLDNFKEMESHGFSTIRFQVFLNRFLEMIEAEKKLQENLAKVESKIKEVQVEKIVAERKLGELAKQMKSIEEQVKSNNSLKILKEQQLSELESRRGIISEELLGVSNETLAWKWLVFHLFCM